MKNGFTLIEVIIVILIIGIVSSIGIPKFMSIGQTGIDKFFGQLNNLTMVAAQYAIKTNTVQKVVFNLISKKVELVDINSTKSKKSIAIPDSVEFNDVFINGKPQFLAGATKYDAYFLINPDGISQEVRLILTDKAIQAKNPRLGNVQLQLNPFIVQFQPV